MITMNEILINRVKLEELPQVIQDNLNLLLQKINVIRKAYNKPMKVNDGYRRPQDTPKHGAIKSKHLEGLAIDIDDNLNGDLWKWCIANLQLLQDTGLWLEHGCWTHYIDPETKQERSWVHFQIVSPNSRKRIFIPSLTPNPNPSFWDGKYDSKYDK